MQNPDPVYGPNERIVAMARGRPIGRPSPWRFVGTGVMIINDREDLDVFKGDLYYMNPDYQCACAIRMRGFVFCLMRPIEGSALYNRLPEAERDRWEVVAINGSNLFSMGSLHDASSEELNCAMETLVCSQYFPILFHEVIASSSNVFTVQWKSRRYHQGDNVFSMGTASNVTVAPVDQVE